MSVNKETIFSNFIKTNGIINYELILKKILLPYFKIKRRIVKKGFYFKIGEIEFKVCGVYPGKKGVITSKTYVHCNNNFSRNINLERALLLTTQRYENFNQEVFLKELFERDISNVVISKNELIELNQYEFFVRNCIPESGKINNQTEIKIENKEIYNITKIKVAVIKVKYIKILLLVRYSRFSEFNRKIKF